LRFRYPTSIPQIQRAPLNQC